ncbi:hypothetical protein ASPFODRAFT_65876 [Aspergillus luchuensis CBS 106.47]|uniref:Uncharacterized protein n=1 Tax=Aspergillus luchuensis (strain CBS 106.47) TaxID=1137211 RepID=A0A1M3T182_ASPLC|nr:hypothetical protein ASPFODRAFT_65876 [Aspergillus luchuensis CBS 106.47]
MSGNSSPDYKALFLKEAELRRQAEERERQAEEWERQQRERNRPTTFPEFIQHCHDLLWRPLRAQTPSRSTTGRIPAPIGKHCPIRLLPWTDCEARQREIYQSVCRYLQPDLETYERLTVEDHVHEIIAELCKIPEACEEFRLGNGIWDGDRRTLLTTVEYETPHKLSAANLRLGLRPMDFWREVVQVQPGRVPTEEPEKSTYYAERLVGSAIVQ